MAGRIGALCVVLLLSLQPLIGILIARAAPPSQNVEPTPLSPPPISAGYSLIEVPRILGPAIHSGDGFLASAATPSGAPPQLSWSLSQDSSIQAVLVSAVSVAGGWNHTCAVTDAGGVKCWGQNTYGQLGDGTTVDRLTPMDVTGLQNDVIAVRAGYGHTCALTGGGSIKCWGANSDGQLGDGTNIARLTPVTVKGFENGATALTLGFEHTCAITSAGGVRCWGRNDQGQIGDGTISYGGRGPVDVIGLDGNATALAAGVWHTCAVDGGVAKCWGENSHGQLGDGTRDNRATPTIVSGLSPGIVSLGAGSYHTCAVTQSGGAKCWGDNSMGQLGTGGGETARPLPGDVIGLVSGVSLVTSGADHTCAIDSGGGVKCWGGNRDGQLGVGSEVSYSLTPLSVSEIPVGAYVLAAGERHTCAVTDRGGVKCWGYNWAGQIGDGTSQHRPEPVDVYNLSGGSGAVAVSAGWGHTCAVFDTEQARCWGMNLDGQLGDGSRTIRYTPVAVASLSGLRAISSGNHHTCAITPTGGVKCWGGNTSGQLGDGTRY